MLSGPARSAPTTCSPTNSTSEFQTPSPVGLKTVMEFLALDDPKAKGVDPTSFVDGSILKELDDSGFIKSLYER
jgi:hypothetical protein